MAQQVKRAAALTAQLATQSEEKTAAVCDRPPALSELAGHIEAPNMGAGGSHPEVTMMLDPRARSCRPSEGQTMVKAPPETVTHDDSSRRPFAPTRGFRGARIRSTTRAPLNTRSHDNAAVLQETLRLFVEATDEDEASMRQQLVNKRPAELLRSREFWKTRVEEKQHFQAKKKEAWEFFRRMPSFKPKNQEEFEEEFKRG